MGAPRRAERPSNITHWRKNVPDYFLAACALVLVLEGLLPLLAPRVWRDAFRRLIELSDGQLRFVGLISLAIGAVILMVFYA